MLVIGGLPLAPFEVIGIPQGSVVWDKRGRSLSAVRRGQISASTIQSQRSIWEAR